MERIYNLGDIELKALSNKISDHINQTIRNDKVNEK